MYINAMESGAVLNNIDPHKVIQVIHHLKPEAPKATGHLSTSVTSSVNQMLMKPSYSFYWTVWIFNLPSSVMFKQIMDFIGPSQKHSFTPQGLDMHQHLSPQVFNLMNVMIRSY